MLTRTGPLTRNPGAVALGLAQIRVGAAAANIANAAPALLSTDSVGALANTKYVGKADFWKLESGFPLLEDLSIPIRESSQLDCAFKELTVKNIAMARGIDPSTIDEYDDSIALGGLVAPDYVRMEAVYTFPDAQTQMIIIFPRANVVSSMEIDLKESDAAAVPVSFEAKRADDGVTGGNSAWNSMPLGTIVFVTGGDMV
ncbi:MAG: hypothetical protein LLG05_09605 [Porphyromonadaceae bacterium]|nr:hypothetical protein [Porphyromonadaceae bacterium]